MQKALKHILTASAALFGICFALLVAAKGATAFEGVLPLDLAIYPGDPQPFDLNCSYYPSELPLRYCYMKDDHGTISLTVDDRSGDVVSIVYPVRHLGLRLGDLLRRWGPPLAETCGPDYRCLYWSTTSLIVDVRHSFTLGSTVVSLGLRAPGYLKVRGRCWHGVTSPRTPSFCWSQV